MAELRVKSTGTLKLFENDNTSSVTIASPASLGGDRTVTLPDASVTLASGTMLATDGDGSSLTGLPANTPAFSAKLGSDLTMDSATTVYDVVFGTEYFDVGSCYDASNGIFTVPSGEGGKYYISTSCMFLDDGGELSDFILYMHSTISASASQDTVARAKSTDDGALFMQRELTYNTIISLSAGDAIKIQVYQQTNDASTIILKSGGRNTVFSAFKLIE